MKKPLNLESFIELINSMDHRERFVFKANNSVCQKYGENHLFIEVYNTILFESKNLDRNITVHLCLSDGKPISKKAKLHRLWNKEFYSKVFNNIASEVSEKIPLELSE
jgi:hypothetical protein